MKESNYDRKLKELQNASPDTDEKDSEVTKNSDNRAAKSSAKSYMASICSRSEYCIFDIKEKLKKRQLNQDDINDIIDYLVKERFIDEKRYCRSYVNDKYKYSKWGKIKIVYMLKSKRIDNDLIYSSIDENIDEEVYLQNLSRILTEKKKSIKSSDKYELKGKLFRFAASRGYESDDISKVIADII